MTFLLLWCYKSIAAAHTSIIKSALHQSTHTELKLSGIHATDTMSCQRNVCFSCPGTFANSIEWQTQMRLTHACGMHGTDSQLHKFIFKMAETECAVTEGSSRAVVISRTLGIRPRPTDQQRAKPRTAWRAALKPGVNCAGRVGRTQPCRFCWPQVRAIATELPCPKRWGPDQGSSA